MLIQTITFSRNIPVDEFNALHNLLIGLKSDGKIDSLIARSKGGAGRDPVMEFSTETNNIHVWTQALVPVLQKYSSYINGKMSDPPIESTDPLILNPHHFDI